eukprot:scaffold3234_cov178-Ochromonas_danica.AAC.3
MRLLSMRRLQQNITGLTTLLLSFFYPTHPFTTTTTTIRSWRMMTSLPVTSSSSSYPIDSSFYHIEETGISTKLPLLVQRRVSSLEKHITHHVLPRHTLLAFESAVHFVDHFYHSSSSSSSQAVILDSGCGKGKSSVLLAKQFPHLPVIGIDRSLARLSSNYHYNTNKNTNKKTEEEEQQQQEEEVVVVEQEEEEEQEEVNRELPSLPNLILLRADLSSFWYLASLHSPWTITQHYLLHPNPYPKPKLLPQRLYLDASYPLALSLGGEWIMRSSWRTYCEEMVYTTDYIMKKVNPSFPTPCTVHYQGSASSSGNSGGSSKMKGWSHFEEKFLAAGVPLYEVKMRLGERSPAERKQFIAQLINCLNTTTTTTNNSTNNSTNNNNNNDDDDVSVNKEEEEL